MDFVFLIENIVFVFLYVVLLAVSSELIRRYLKTGWFLFLLLPLFLTFYWFSLDDHSRVWLTWAKIYTLAIGNYLIVKLRFSSSLQKQKWPYYAIFFLLVINMIEAISFAFDNQSLWIAYSGIMLLFSIPGPSGISVDLKSKYKDLTYNFPWGWIVAYTIWDEVLIFTTFSDAAIYCIAILLAPIILSLFDFKSVSHPFSLSLNNRILYIQARAFTLYLSVLFGFTFPKIKEAFSLPYFFNTPEQNLAGIVAFAWVGIYFLGFLIKKIRKQL